MSGWTNPLNLIYGELVQRADEGCVIPAALHQAIQELHVEHDAWNIERIDPLYDALMALPHDDGLAAREPNDLEAIHALRPEGPRSLAWKPSESQAIERFHGAWTGRCVGCALGKPVEGMGMRGTPGRPDGRTAIKRYLTLRGEWPLNEYFSTRAVPDGDNIGCPESTRERIAYMEPDDDIHYSLVGLGVIEQHGPTFTWHDVARYWLEHIPNNFICTAETQAILNYMNRLGRMNGSAAVPAWTRRHRNPYREWIGAQIRSDGWAWVCAGRPELAAEFAWRDAHWTHERNGIYGEMYLAAMQAAAFVVDDPWKIVEIGLSEIPRDCRLAIAVRELCGWMRDCRDWEACMDRVDTRWAKMSAVHTINNALICTLSLVYGGMDPHRSTCISVSAGLDTDCNGASVGSIVGAAAGRARFNSPLVAPLNDTIKPAIVGFTQVTMAALAQRTWVQWQRVDAWKTGTVAPLAKAATA